MYLAKVNTLPTFQSTATSDIKLIGVCSYLLIGYWSHRLSAIKSAQKAILVNRISDGLLQCQRFRWFIYFDWSYR